MEEVFLDGEPVDFQGPPPATKEQLWQILERHLAQSGARLERLVADGREWRPGEPEGGCKRVEAYSVFQIDDWRGLAREVTRVGRQISERARREAGASLSREWQATREACVETLEFSKPALEGLGALVRDGLAEEAEGRDSLRQGLEAVEGITDAVIRALREEKVVALSDTLEDGLAPAWLGIAELLEARFGLDISAEARP